MKNIKAAVCVKCGTEFIADRETYTCTAFHDGAKCGGILEIVLDYDYIKTRISPEKFAEKNYFLRRTFPG
jgi:threonine synthase